MSRILQLAAALLICLSFGPTPEKMRNFCHLNPPEFSNCQEMKEFRKSAQARFKGKFPSISYLHLIKTGAGSPEDLRNYARNYAALTEEARLLDAKLALTLL